VRRGKGSGSSTPSTFLNTSRTKPSVSAWIAASPEDYVARAVELARDPARIARARKGLRERMRASPLMDEARFARDMEALYRQMWREWCTSSR